MTHEEWFEKGDIYALGALDGAELSDFEAHLRGDCVICEAYLRETRETLMLLHRALSPVAPPAAIKSRVLAGTRNEKVASLEVKKQPRGDAGRSSSEPWPRESPSP